MYDMKSAGNVFIVSLGAVKILIFS